MQTKKISNVIRTIIIELEDELMYVIEFSSKY